MNLQKCNITSTSIAIILFVICMVTAYSCKEEPTTTPTITNEVKIISLTVEDSVLNAWQTINVAVIAEGDSLEYSWEADHGEINGSGSQIQYMAGTCCEGINTITCTVSNTISSKSQQIKVRVLPF